MATPNRRRRLLAKSAAAGERGGSVLSLWERMFVGFSPGTSERDSQPGVVSLCADTLDSFLEESGERLCIIDFYTVWCGPCKIVEKHINSMAQKYTHVRFGKFDCEAEGNNELSSALGIHELPTIVVYQQGNQMRRFSGTSGIGEVMGMAEIWNDKAQQSLTESDNGNS